MTDKRGMAPRWTRRWVASEYGTAESKAHLLPDCLYVTALCGVPIGNSTTDNDRPRCKRCERIVEGMRCEVRRMTDKTTTVAPVRYIVAETWDNTAMAEAIHEAQLAVYEKRADSIEIVCEPLAWGGYMAMLWEAIPIQPDTESYNEWLNRSVWFGAYSYQGIPVMPRYPHAHMGLFNDGRHRTRAFGSGASQVPPVGCLV